MSHPPCTSTTKVDDIRGHATWLYFPRPFSRSHAKDVRGESSGFPHDQRHGRTRRVCICLQRRPRTHPKTCRSLQSTADRDGRDPGRSSLRYRGGNDCWSRRIVPAGLWRKRNEEFGRGPAVRVRLTFRLPVPPTGRSGIVQWSRVRSSCARVSRARMARRSWQPGRRAGLRSRRAST